VRHAEGVILKAGIALGASAFTREQAQANLKRGHRLLVYGFDVLMLRQHVKQAMQWTHA
jgi:2-keto-3-deoxy-L-rhamnonate aldolase RhmA